MAGKRLTVLQILPTLESGGVERGTLEVAAALVRAGHRSIVVSAGGQLVDRLVASGSEHIQLPVARKSPSALLQVRPLRRILQEARVDILHMRSRLPAWIAWLAWHGMPPGQRPGLVTTVHGLYSVNRYSEIMTRGERVIAVSDTARNYILENYPDTDPRRIVTIYRGVDREEFPYGYEPDKAWLSGWYDEYPLLKEAAVLTLPGRLTRLKGHEDFIRLVGVLAKKDIRLHGLIVGYLDPARRKYISELKQLIADNGLESRITFTGQRSDIRNIYACSNVVLSLSLKPESYGRTVTEALSLGIPVVGYDHGGVGEVLARYFPDGRSPVGNVARLAENVIRILGNSGRIPGQAIFTKEEMLEQTLSLYQDLTE